MAQTVVGMFDNTSEAQQAVEALVNHGISRDRIDVSASTSSYSSSETGTSDARSSDHHESGISKFFKNLFGDDDDDAGKYSHVASRAQSIVTVHSQTSDEAERAADILDDNGAIDVNEKASQYGYGTTSAAYGSTNTTTFDDTRNTTAFGDTSNTTGAFDTGTVAGGLSGTASTAGDFTADRTADLTGRDASSYDESKKIPIIEENLEVGKREVNTGGLRLRSRIVERPVEESIRLREERVNVERNSVDRPATEADFNNFEERDIEMVERAEVPVVNKKARVVEEVSLNKEVEERSETINDTVRKTEVDVDDIESNDSDRQNRNL